MSHRHFRAGIVLASSGLLLAQSDSACQPPPELARALKSAPTSPVWSALGAHYAQHHQLGCAVNAFESALRLDPNSGEAHYNLAVALLEQGAADRAASELRLALKQQPNRPDVRNALGSAYLGLHQPDRAEEEFKAALKLDPANVYALERLAGLLIDAGRYTAAINYLRQAPNDPELRTSLAIAYSKNGSPDEAIAVLQKLVVEQPGSAIAHFNLATEHAHQKAYRAAADEYRETLRLDPGNDLARISLVKALNILAEYSEALPIIEDYAGRKSGDFDSPYLLGEVYRGLGRYADAVPLLGRAARMQPGNYDVQYNLGFVLAKVSRYAEARSCFERALALRPDDGPARYQLGLVLRALNQPDLAKQELIEFEQQKRRSGQKDIAAVTGGAANKMLLEGDAQRAVQGYRESLREDPGNARTHYNLALALERLADLKGERQSLEQALKLEPKLALAQNQMGLLNLREGRAAEAEAGFKIALSLDPQFAEAQSNLGVLYGQQDKLKEAEALFRQSIENSPDYSQAYLNLGLILAREARFSEARNELQHAAGLTPQSFPALTALAMVETRLGRQDEAIGVFRKIVSLSPKSSEAHLNLGIALADRFDLPGALAEFSEAVALAPDSAAAHYNKGRSLFDLKNYDEAETELEQACRLSPDAFDALYLLALTEKQRADYAKSAQLLERALPLNPKDADARHLLAQDLLKLDRKNEAIAQWKTVVEIKPQHSEALYNLARALQVSDAMAAEGYRARFSDLQKKRMVNDRAGTLSDFAVAAAASHDFPKAIAQLREALDVCGECSSRGTLHKNLGLIFCRSGDLESGARELKIAQRVLLGDADIAKSLQIIASLQQKVEPHK